MKMAEVTNLLNIASTAARFLLLWSWQAALLIGLVWLGLKAYRSQPAALRYQIWLSGLMAVAALPLWMIFVRALPFPGPSSMIISDLVELPVVIVSALSVVSGQSSVAKTTDNGPLITDRSVPLIWVLLFALWAAFDSRRSHPPSGVISAASPGAQ
jgi:hypothetical protein